MSLRPPCPQTRPAGAVGSADRTSRAFESPAAARRRRHHPPQARWARRDEQVSCPTRHLLSPPSPLPPPPVALTHRVCLLILTTGADKAPLHGMRRRERRDERRGNSRAARRAARQFASGAAICERRGNVSGVCDAACATRRVGRASGARLRQWTACQCARWAARQCAVDMAGGMASGATSQCRCSVDGAPVCGASAAQWYDSVSGASVWLLVRCAGNVCMTSSVIFQFH